MSRLAALAAAAAPATATPATAAHVHKEVVYLMDTEPTTSGRLPRQCRVQHPEAWSSVRKGRASQSCTVLATSCRLRSRARHPAVPRQ